MAEAILDDHSQSVNDSSAHESNGDDSETEHQVDIIRGWSQSTGKDRTVVIVTAGKSGVGKSTLINNFFRLTGDGASEARMQPTSVTHSVKAYNEVVHDVNVRVVDTPGLFAVDNNQADDKAIIRQLNDLTKGKADVVFYCMNVTNRIDKVDLENIDILTNSFGKEIWEHTIFVFTHADIAQLQGYNLEELVEKFVETIEQQLKKREIKVCIRSFCSFKSDKERETFNGIVGMPVSKDLSIPPEWRVTLLLQAIRKCNEDNISAFLQLSLGKKWREILKTAVITVTGGMTGAAIGTAVGAGIGAAVGGILTVPIGGAGAIPTAAGGAAIGAWIGTAVGVGGAGSATFLARLVVVIKSRYNDERQARQKIKEMIKKEKKRTQART